MKIGLFVNGIKMKEYPFIEYDNALEYAMFVFKQTKVPFEIKILKKNYRPTVAVVKR